LGERRRRRSETSNHNGHIDKRADVIKLVVVVVAVFLVCQE